MGLVHPEVAAIEAELAAVKLQRDLAGRVVRLPEIVAGWQRQRLDDSFDAEGPLLGLLPFVDLLPVADSLVDGSLGRFHLADLEKTMRISHGSPP